MEFNKQYFLDKLRYKNTELRDGQAIFIEVNNLFPDECTNLSGSNVDCFYYDDLIEPFLEKIKQLVEKTNDVSIIKPYTTYYPNDGSQEIDAEELLKKTYAKVANEKLDDIARSCEEQPTISFNIKNNFIENDTYQWLRYWMDKVYKRNKKSLKIFYRLGESMEKRKIREAKL